MATKISETIADRTVNELWWVGMIQGVLAIFFGITALFWPDLTLVTLVYLFSAFILGLGMAETVVGLLSVRTRSTWWVTLLIGLIGVGVGVYLVRHPDASFSTFILVTGLGLIARGVLDGVRTFIDKTSTGNRILLSITSLAAIAAGIIILLQPVRGGLAFVWVLGLYGLIYGALTIAIAFELRRELEEILTAGYAPATPAKAR
jgi:uncharacterized membrane protein HdeD (DUF308 family)